ncbi:MAG TPA: transporter [Micromonosporaceae bacterium]|nr:transporter [Micromonosporaceae bacterium]
MTNDLTNDERPPATPADSMRLIREQRAAAGRRLFPSQLYFLVPWGLAWLIGFGLFFLRYGPNDRTYLSMPGWLPLVALLGLLGVSMVISAVASARAYRHMAGPSALKGAMYGWAFFLGFLSLGVSLARVSDELPPNDQGLLWAAASVALVGALHMAGGAVWHDKSLFALGVWLSLVNVAGVIAGPGWHSLVIALAGGGGLLAFGAVLAVRRRTWLAEPV